jgi:hypothetical protein
MLIFSWIYKLGPASWDRENAQNLIECHHHILYYQTITFTMRVMTSYHSLLPPVTSSSSAPDSGTGIKVQAELCSKQVT